MQRALINIFFLVVLPALVGMACLQTAYPTATAPTDTPTKSIQEQPTTIPAAAALVQPVATKPACARVDADEALHLRQDPDPKSRVLAYMARGEVVKLLSTINADWWLIDRAGVVGFARAKYLKRASCG